jgi:hypothetical protein
LILVPVNAEERSSSRQQLEQTIVERLARGQDVRSFTKSLPARTQRSAARSPLPQEAHDTAQQLADLHQKLQVVSRKGRLSSEHIAPLLAS